MSKQIVVFPFETSLATKETRSPFTLGLGRLPPLRPSRVRSRTTTSFAESVTQSRPTSVAPPCGPAASVIGAPGAPPLATFTSSE